MELNKPRSRPLGDSTGELSVAQQGNLRYLKKALHQQWNLGQNILLCWTATDAGVSVLVAPHYFLARFSTSLNDCAPVDRLDALNGSFIRKLIAGSRQMEPLEFNGTARRLDLEPTHIKLPIPVQGEPLAMLEIESLVRRYSISYVENRAVLLFDIVDFSLFTPFEQASQLNSLSYSINSAHNKMLKHNIKLDLARTTTGDGFYIWNRDQSPQANLHLYQFMLTVVADNAIARQKAAGRTVPRIRTGFHIGSHYEFSQAEALSPTTQSFIVGDVTIELARMLENANSGQIFIGDFVTRVPTSLREGAYLIEVDSVRFVERVRKNVELLKGVELSGERIDAIHCYLTGETGASGGETVRRFRITDKHGRTRNAYNVRINIRTEPGKSILLGTQTNGGVPTGSTGQMRALVEDDYTGYRRARNRRIK